MRHSVDYHESPAILLWRSSNMVHEFHDIKADDIHLIRLISDDTNAFGDVWEATCHMKVNCQTSAPFQSAAGARGGVIVFRIFPLGRVICVCSILINTLAACCSQSTKRQTCR